MTVVERCATTLRDQTVSMNDRFHALFQLRSIGTPDAVDALLEVGALPRELLPRPAVRRMGSDAAYAW